MWCYEHDKLQLPFWFEREKKKFGKSSFYESIACGPITKIKIYTTFMAKLLALNINFCIQLKW